MTDFAELLRTLANARVEFVLVGGVAAIAHGSARQTLDIDIVYARSTKNIGQLVSALAPHRPYLRGAPPGLPFAWNVATVERGLNFTLTTSLGDIDLLGEITGGGGYDELCPHTIKITAFGTECLCLDLENLIRVKRAVGRPKDLEVIAELEALREEGSDVTGEDGSDV
jgi:predicted nucleotidyltransferase